MCWMKVSRQLEFWKKKLKNLTELNKINRFSLFLIFFCKFLLIALKKEAKFILDEE